jgi:NADPH:quinone reductase-like Zn-dependent oxidoreductase
MKALIFRQFGGLEHLEYTDVPEPFVGPDEVLVRVRAVALNYLDVLLRQGIPDLRVTMPHIGGCDIAGEVVAVGEDVPDLWVDSRVVVNPALIVDHSDPYPDISIIGEHTRGGFAEYASVPVENILPLPPDFSFAQAAATPLAFQTAWRALVTRASLRPGEHVLILEAGTGVASAAIQIAKLAGAYVYATTSTPENMQRATDVGADEVINYREEDFARAIWQRTGKRGVDVILVENIDTQTWEASMRTLSRGGRLVIPGSSTSTIGETNISLLFWKQLSLIGTTAATHPEFRRVMDLIFGKRLTPVVDRVMPLSEGREAQRILETGEYFGKIVLEP